MMQSGTIARLHEEEEEEEDCLGSTNSTRKHMGFLK